ncbi:MAG: hypothetical protein U0T84_12555 [Chitinophagales bacterium]
MKKIVPFLFLAVCFSVKVFSQCPEEGTLVPIQKVMNPATSKDYQSCDITIESEFIFSTVTNFQHPGKISKMVVFQVAPVGEGENYADRRGQRGLMVAIDKSKSDEMFTWKKGQKVSFEGHTQVVMGSIVYFLADSYKTF